MTALSGETFLSFMINDWNPRNYREQVRAVDAIVIDQWYKTRQFLEIQKKMNNSLSCPQPINVGMW